MSLIDLFLLRCIPNSYSSYNKIAYVHIQCSLDFLEVKGATQNGPKMLLISQNLYLSQPENILILRKLHHEQKNFSSQKCVSSFGQIFLQPHIDLLAPNFV